jgi:hypothetical protein
LADGASNPAASFCSTSAALIICSSWSKGIVRVKFFPPLPQLSRTVTLTRFTLRITLQPRPCPGEHQHRDAPPFSGFTRSAAVPPLSASMARS